MTYSVKLHKHTLMLGVITSIFILISSFNQGGQAWAGPVTENTIVCGFTFPYFMTNTEMSPAISGKSDKGASNTGKFEYFKIVGRYSIASRVVMDMAKNTIAKKYPKSDAIADFLAATAWPYTHLCVRGNVETTNQASFHLKPISFSLSDPEKNYLFPSELEGSYEIVAPAGSTKEFLTFDKKPDPNSGIVFEIPELSNYIGPLFRDCKNSTSTEISFPFLRKPSLDSMQHYMTSKNKDLLVAETNWNKLTLYSEHMITCDAEAQDYVHFKIALNKTEIGEILGNISVLRDTQKLNISIDIRKAPR